MVPLYRPELFVLDLGNMYTLSSHLLLATYLFCELQSFQLSVLPYAAGIGTTSSGPSVAPSRPVLSSQPPSCAAETVLVPVSVPVPPVS